MWPVSGASRTATVLGNASASVWTARVAARQAATVARLETSLWPSRSPCVGFRPSPSPCRSKRPARRSQSLRSSCGAFRAPKMPPPRRGAAKAKRRTKRPTPWVNKEGSSYQCGEWNQTIFLACQGFSSAPVARWHASVPVHGGSQSHSDIRLPDIVALSQKVRECFFVFHHKKDAGTCSSSSNCSRLRFLRDGCRNTAPPSSSC